MSSNDELARNESAPDPFDVLLISAAVLAIASLLLRQFTGPDEWWQIAIGRDILANLSIPRIDQFSAAGWGRNYHDSHWLFQVLVAAADRVGGADAVGIVPVIVWSSTLYCCYRSIRCWVSPAAGCLLLFAVAVSCNYRFTPRPETISCLMIALYYLRLQSGRYATVRQLALFALLQVLWSNSHGLFVIGPFMAGCYLAESIWKRFRGESQELLPSARLLAVLIVASICTPFGLDGWHYALQIAQQAGPGAHLIYSSLEELRPTFSRDMLANPDVWGFLFILVACAATSCTQALRRKAPPVSRLFMVAALLAAAASGRRNMPLFTLTAAPLFAETISLMLPERSLAKSWKVAAAILLIGFCWLPLSGHYYQWFGYDPVRFGIGPAPQSQPTGLPAFLRQINFSGQIYNNDLFGGYCLYHGILPLVDGRWEVYDQQELTTILRAPYDQAAWEWVLERYAIKGALLHNGAVETRALVMRFFADNSFQLVYQDNISSFWLRTASPFP